jgi:hypothetical protein
MQKVKKNTTSLQPLTHPSGEHLQQFACVFLSVKGYAGKNACVG